MGTEIEPDRYADTGFSIADTPPELNAFLFQQMMRKSGAERLEIGCRMNDSARALVWSGIPQDLPEAERRTRYLQRFYGEADPTVAAITGPAPRGTGILPGAINSGGGLHPPSPKTHQDQLTHNLAIRHSHP